MNKKLIALAVGTALAAPLAANADVTVYGQGQVEVAAWASDAEGVSSVDNARGRIGIKGTEDLGGGLKALFKAEYKTDFSDGVASGSDVSLSKREMMVGLKGNWGEFQAGRLKTPYKYSGGVKYDPLVATVLEARQNGGMSGKEGRDAYGGAAGHNGFASDTIAYKWSGNGFRIWAQYDVQDANSDTNPTNDDGANGYSASAAYGQKNWEVFVAYVTDDADSTVADPTETYSSVKGGGQIKFLGAHTISAQYEAATQEYNGFNDDDINTWFLGYQFKFGKNNLVLQGGTADDDRVSNDVKYWAIALVHKFSKKTRVWVGYRQSDDMYDIDGDGNQDDVGVGSVGLRVDI